MVDQVRRADAGRLGDLLVGSLVEILFSEYRQGAIDNLLASLNAFLVIVCGHGMSSCGLID